LKQTLVRKPKKKINGPRRICLDRITTITGTQAYWDVSGAKTTFTTIQKLFSNLSDFEKVTC